MLGDDFVHDFVGTAADGHDAVVAKEPFHQVAAHKTVSAEYLGGVEGGLVADHAGEVLGHGHFLDLVLPGIYQGRHPVGKFPAGFHHGSHLRQFVAGNLEPGKRLTESLPFLYVLDGLKSCITIFDQDSKYKNSFPIYLPSGDPLTNVQLCISLDNQIFLRVNAFMYIYNQDGSIKNVG